MSQQLVEDALNFLPRTGEAMHEACTMCWNGDSLEGDAKRGTSGLMEGCSVRIHDVASYTPAFVAYPMQISFSKACCWTLISSGGSIQKNNIGGV